MRRSLLTAAGLLGIAALLTLSVAAGREADARTRQTEAMIGRELIYLPSPAQARVMSLGFEQLVADWYWVRALQYFVEPANEMHQYKNLGDFLDVVVGVDPDFAYAYKFAGLSIPFDTGRMKYMHSERAIGFLERGVARFPQSWEMRLYLGFYYLNFRLDSAKAAEQFALAAPIPGAPPYLKRFAARLFSVSGEIERAKAFTEQMLSITEDPVEQERLRKRLKEVELEGRFRDVEAAARRFRDENGRWPYALVELAGTYSLPELPPGTELHDGTLTSPEVKRLVVYEHPLEDAVRAAP